jgi:hypothetical protein
VFNIFTNIIVDVAKTSVMELTHVTDLWPIILVYLFANKLKQSEVNYNFLPKV